LKALSGAAREIQFDGDSFVADEFAESAKLVEHGFQVRQNFGITVGSTPGNGDGLSGGGGCGGKGSLRKRCASETEEFPSGHAVRFSASILQGDMAVIRSGIAAQDEETLLREVPVVGKDFGIKRAADRKEICR
jgi:hypothetical protein